MVGRIQKQLHFQCRPPNNNPLDPRRLPSMILPSASRNQYASATTRSDRATGQLPCHCVLLRAISSRPFCANDTFSCLESVLHAMTALVCWPHRLNALEIVLPLYTGSDFRYIIPSSRYFFVPDMTLLSVTSTMTALWPRWCSHLRLLRLIT